MLRRFIGVITGGALMLALCLAVAWWWTGSSAMEASATMAALVAAIAGIPAERWASAREQRNRALFALRDELQRNEEIVADERFLPLRGRSVRRRVFPRLSLSAADAAVTSGALASRSDTDLLYLLYQWRDAVRELNHRLDLTEVYLFSADTIQPEEVRRFDEALHSPDGYFTEARAQLKNLEERVLEALKMKS